MRRTERIIHYWCSAVSVAVVLLMAVAPSGYCSSSSAFFGARRRILGGGRISRSYRLSDRLLRLRGGSSTAAAIVASYDKDQQLHAYRLQQQLYLQSRSLQIRQALIQRGFDELQHTVKDGTVAQETDWDCAVATEEYPKTCLYSFDAETGSKVLAPSNTTDWISVAALNRLRRNDPTKVEPLWHSQYSILKTWFGPDSRYSIYTHLPLTGTLLAYLLDAPFLLGIVMSVVVASVFLVTVPVWERLIQAIATMPALWLYWPHWARFVHAALPLKLLLGQMAFKAIASAAGGVYQSIRGKLVEWECQILQDCIPLTILEGIDHENEDDDDEDELAYLSADEFESDDS